MTLGDGNEWTIANQFNLPMEFAIDAATGDDKRAVTAKAEPVWERMQQALSAARNAFLRDQWDVWGQLPESERVGMEAPAPLVDGLDWTDYDIHDYVIWILSLNYRVTKLVSVHLRLFNNQTLWPALMDSTDGAAIWRLQDVQKKLEERLDAWRLKMSGSQGISGGVPA